MSTRINFAKASPDAYKAVYLLDRYVVKESGLDPALIHLIKLRASIINGCAYCVDMHVKESRHDGLSEQWINLVSVWHEATLYTPRERALLGWIDAVTLIAQTRAPDDVYDELRKHFSDDECVKLTTAIGAINVWNRLAVAFRAPHPIDAKAAA